MSAQEPRLALHDGGPLLTADDPLLREIEANLGEDGDSLPLLREELAAYCGLDAPVALFDDLPTARARIARAAVVSAPGRLLCVGGRIAGIEGPVDYIEFDDLAGAPQRIEEAGDLAGVLLEPRGELAVLRAIGERAQRKGLRLVLDESRTASRLTTRTVGEEAGITADAILLGDSLAGGRPFGAVIGLAEPQASCASATARTLRACLRRLAMRGVHEPLSRSGVALRGRFQAACRECDLKARVLGPAALMRIQFDEQDNVDAARITQRFLRELSALGVDCTRDLALSVDFDAVRLQVVAAAFEAAAIALRTRLVEHNASVDDDLPYVFASASGGRHARGLTRFRHPRQVAGAVEVEAGGLRLRLSAGPLGPGASIGFLSRQPLRGDFALTVRFRLTDWHPGPDGASFAVFVQEEASGRRSQALRLELARTQPDPILAATFDGRLCGARATDLRAGWLQIQRVADTLTIAWAEDGEQPGPFLELARRRPVATQDLLAGCRLTGQVHSGGLAVEVRAFAVICPMDTPRVES